MQPEQPVQPIYTPPPVQNDTGGFTKKQKRIMLVVGVLFVLFILIMILAAVFGGQKSSTEVSLTSVNARNSEVIRLIDELEDELKTAVGKSYAAQARILITSDNLAITSYTNNIYSATYTDQQIADTEITSTIASLADRTNQNDFDQVFIDSIRFELKINKALLEQLNPQTLQEPLAGISQTAITNLGSLL